MLARTISSYTSLENLGLSSARSIISPFEFNCSYLNTGNPGAIAHIYLGLGDTEAAMKWLLIAAEHRDAMFASQSMATPIFESVYGNPRFLEVIEMVGLDPAAFR